MAITFRYKTIRRPDGEDIKGPWIPVTFIGPAESLGAVAFLDSGADVSVIPREFAEIIGVDLKKGEKEKCKGVGGDVDAVYTTIQLSIQGGHENYTIDLPIYVLLEQNTETPPLLGRAGFFDEFKITIDQQNEKVVLKKAQSQRH